MTPILYSSDEIDFLNNGLGQLVDLYDVDIHEQRNGLLNLTAYYPVNGQHYADISEGNIILAKPSPLDDNHAFRIVSVSLDITGYAVMIEADSITYDLTNNLSKTIHMLGDGQAAMTAIQNSTLHPHIFTFYSDITHTSESQLRYVNPMEAIAGTQGSFLQIWGGELKRENRRVAMFNRRGRDNVATFRLGKNVAGLKYTVDVSNLTTEIVPTVTVNSTDASRTIEGATVQSSRMGNYPLVYSKMVDVSQDVKVDEGDTDDQIKAKINAIAANWFVKSANTGKDLPEVTVEVEVESLQDSADYADKFAKLETIGLTDTVTVYVPEFGVNVTAIVNELHYDPVTERVTKLSIGTAKVSWADSNKNALNDLQDKVTDVKEQANQAVVSANEKSKNYYGRDAPEHPQEGDTWFWNDGENSGVKVWVNGKWVDSVDTQTNERIDNAVDSAVSEATSHADSLNAAQTSMASSVSASTAAALSAASDERNSLANMTSSVAADAKKTSKSLADSAYAGAMAGVSSATTLIAGVSAAVKVMDSAVAANNSAITKTSNDLAIGLSSAATYADSLTARVGNSTSAAVSSVASDVNGVKAEFDSVRKTTHELSVSTNSLSVGASGIAARLTDVTSTASGAMSAAASLAADASGLHASYDKLSSQHAKDVETMNASYSAGISGIATSMADMKSTEDTLTKATNSLAVTASGLTGQMTSVSSTASGAMSAAASLAANVSGVSASFNKLSNTVTRKIVSGAIDLNAYVTSGKWFFSGSQTNAPRSGWAYVDVDAPSTDRLIQTWTYDQDASLQYSRYSIDNGKTWSSWVKAVQASDVTTAVNSASASYSAGINGLSADIKTVDTNAKGYATAAQNSAVATASQIATTITSAAISNFGTQVASAYVNNTTFNQTVSGFTLAANKLTNKVNALGQINQLFNTEFSPDLQGWSVYLNKYGNGRMWVGSGTRYSDGSAILAINSGSISGTPNDGISFRIRSDKILIKSGITLSWAVNAFVSRLPNPTAINGHAGIVQLVFLDSSGKDIGTSGNYIDSGPWNKYGANNVTTPANAQYVLFEFYTYNSSAELYMNKPMLVFNDSAGDYVPGNYNNNSRVSSLELDVDGITGAVNDPSKGLSATWNLANNGQSIAVQASNAATTALTTAQGIQTTVNNWNTATRNYIANSKNVWITESDQSHQLYSFTIPAAEFSGKTITVSVQVDADGAIGKRVGIEPVFTTNGTNSGLYAGKWLTISTATTTNNRIYATWTLPNNITGINQMQLYIQGVTSGTVKLSKPMLTMGNVLTDWQPAPEDIEGALSSTQSQLAGQITKEVTDRTNQVSTVQTQLSGQITSAVNDAKAGLQTQITQTANGIILQAGASQIRYIRFQMNGNNDNASNHVTEIKLLDSSGNNLLAGKLAKAVGYTSSSTSLANLTNGIMTDYADLNTSNMPSANQWLQFDLGSAQNGDYIAFTGYTGVTRTYRDIIVQVSLDGVYWRTVHEGSLNTYAGDAARSTVRIPVGGSSSSAFMGMFKDNWAIGIKDNAGNLINGINGDSSEMTIAAKKLTVSADTTFLGTNWLNGAVIKDASISNAQIGDAAITSAKIVNLDVNKITGEVANFIRAYWDGQYGSTSITSEGMTVTAGVTTTVFDENGMQLNKSNRSVGRIGVNDLYQDNSKKGLYFGLESTGDFMAWGAQNYAGNPYSTKLSWFRAGAVPSNLPGLIEGFNFEDNVAFINPVEMRGGIKLQGANDRLLVRASNLNGGSYPTFGGPSAYFVYAGSDIYLSSNGTAINLTKIAKAFGGIRTAAIPTGFNSNGTATGWYNVDMG